MIFLKATKEHLVCKSKSLAFVAALAIVSVCIAERSAAVVAGQAALRVGTREVLGGRSGTYLSGLR